MECHVCGSTLVPLVTELPFKLSETTIVILKALQVLQCESCGECVLEDQVTEKIDAFLGRADPSVDRGEGGGRAFTSWDA